jgi:hypothetical protein
MIRSDRTDPDPTVDDVVRMLHGDDYWHHRVKRVLTEAGFQVASIEKEDVHPIWHLRMKRGAFPVERDNTLASRQVRRVLKRSGLNVRPDEFRVLRQDGDRLRCVFLLDLGVPGMLT